MTTKELIEALEEQETKYGQDVTVAIDVTPPAEANEIIGVNRVYESTGGVLVLALKLGWRIA